MEQHGDIPECPEPKRILCTAPSGRRWLGIPGCRSCRQAMCSPIAGMANGVVSDGKIGLGITNAYDDRSPEWGFFRSRGEVGGDGDAPCALAPAER